MLIDIAQPQREGRGYLVSAENSRMESEKVIEYINLLFLLSYHFCCSPLRVHKGWSSLSSHGPAPLDGSLTTILDPRPDSRSPDPRLQLKPTPADLPPEC